MARGIERARIFRDDADRDGFLRRLGRVIQGGDALLYAWALIPNHFHLLLRTGRTSLSRTMHRLMTGHACEFNRRYRRSGHLFQNRYRSILCEDEPYFLELVRYLHLNPLRAKLVRNLRELERYPYCGHGTLLGRVVRSWQQTDEVLARFHSRRSEAVKAYRAFVADGVSQGRRPDLMGGGLIRSAGGWQAVVRLRRGREVFRADERILGSSEFVERILQEAEETTQPPGRNVDLATLGKRIARDKGVSWHAIKSAARSRAVSEARAVLAYTWVRYLGRSGRELAHALGITPQAVYAAIARTESKPPSRSRIDRWTR